MEFHGTFVLGVAIPWNSMEFGVGIKFHGTFKAPWNSMELPFWPWKIPWNSNCEIMILMNFIIWEVYFTVCCMISCYYIPDNPFVVEILTWWRHQMETFSALLAICAGNSPASGEFPAQKPVTRSFDVFFDLCLNKRLRKQSWGWWFETPSRPLWRHCNEIF